MSKLILLFLLLTFITCHMSHNYPFLKTSLFADEDQKAGLIDLGDGDDMFFWLFRARISPATTPLVFWLTGGPGCSSELAVFYENGPFSINDDLTLKTNPNSWNNKANVVFIDQPVGTGFSKCSNPTHYAINEEMVAENFYKFLMKFLNQFPEFKKRSIYITGESYAGHYIPAIADYMVSHPHEDMNFKGLAIGNGWVDPYVQYPAYAEFSYENKLIGEPFYYILKAAFAACQGLIATGLWPIAFYECQLSATTILGPGMTLMPAFNVYDIRRKCDVPPLCYDFNLLDKLMARADIRAELGVGDRSWTSCNMVVHTFMLGDWTTNLADKVENLVKKGLKVLVYSGEKDWVCNWRGGEAWTNALNWAGREEFVNQTYSKWNVNGKAAGEYKQVLNLTFLKIYEAGHMVPMDQPVNAVEMLNEFIDETSKTVLK